jgi:menaquinone-dependent protoporphyrinogen oxidase
MARILVIYGTTHGHARKVAEAIGERLQRVGVRMKVLEASRHGESPEPYDGVVVVGSVYARGYQRGVVRWVRTYASVLAHKPTAFVSVCLGVLQHDAVVDQELADVRERFYALTGWRPTRVKVVAGALAYTRYNWLTRRVMRRISVKVHRDTDVSRDYEYTDWNDLARFAEAFAAEVLARLCAV